MYVEVIKYPPKNEGALFVSGKDKSRLIPGVNGLTCGHGIYTRAVWRVSYIIQLKHMINLAVGTISHLHAIILTYGIKKNTQKEQIHSVSKEHLFLLVTPGVPLSGRPRPARKS